MGPAPSRREPRAVGCGARPAARGAACARTAARRPRRPRARRRRRRASRRRPAPAERQQVRQPAGGARAQPAGGVLGQPAHDEPRERGRQRGEVAELDAVAPGERRVDHDVEHLGLVAQQLGGAQQVRLGGRVQLAQRRERPRADPAAHEGVRRRCSRPRPTRGRAPRTTPPVSSRSIPAASSGRIEQPAPLGHARAARGARARRRAGRGSSRPGRSSCARRRAARRAPRRARSARAVAHVARPGLEVPGAGGRRDVLDVQRDLQPPAERLARGLVVAGLRRAARS